MEAFMKKYDKIENRPKITFRKGIILIQMAAIF